MSETVKGIDAASVSQDVQRLKSDAGEFVQGPHASCCKQCVDGWGAFVIRPYGIRRVWQAINQGLYWLAGFSLCFLLV